VIAVLANDQAPDSQIDRSSLKVVRDPANGQTNLNSQAGTIEYIPNSKCEISGSLQIVVACGKTTFIGDDNFEYQVCNTEGECANAQVKVTVTNQSPIISDDAVVTIENTPVSIPIFDNDSDPEDELDLGALQIITQPSHGTLSADAQQSRMLYTPEKGYVGDDSFAYQLCDLRKACDTATVTIQVQPARNRPPLAQDDTATVESGGEVIISILDNDSDPDGKLIPSSLKIIQAPANGTLNVNPGSGAVLYTPKQGFVGTDSFVYAVADEDGAQSSATVTIDVTLTSGGVE
jgi:CshA-type fibril repeat protein